MKKGSSGGVSFPQVDETMKDVSRRGRRSIKRLSEAIDLERAPAWCPAPPQIQDVSIIVPVRNNEVGVNRFLREFFKTHSVGSYPREIIVVDNNSDAPIQIDGAFLLRGLDIRLLRCQRRGPAAARNRGAASALGEWLLFCDSDCIPTSTLLSGYLMGGQAAIAFAGLVRPATDDLLSRYYHTEQTLLPYQKPDSTGRYAPLYVVTANSLVWRPAFHDIGGFDEIFTLAAGEDVDLGVRLWARGRIVFEPNSVVLHDFGDGLVGFCRRFYRYGRGNRKFERKHNVTMRPHFKRPRGAGSAPFVLACIQFLAMWTGYQLESWATPDAPARRGDA